MEKENALKVYIGIRFLFSLFFTTIVTVNLVYQATVVGLNPLQLVLVGTLLETVSFLFEIPTGVVADAYSRKVSVVIGHFLLGCGFIIEGSIASFSGVLLAQVVWGIGYTFISGAREAWIADEIGEENAGKAFIKGTQASQIGTILGTATSMVLGNIYIRLPILLGGLFFCILAGFLLLMMPEKHFSPTPVEGRTTFRSMKCTLIDGIKLIDQRRILVFVLLTGMIFGMFSEGLDRLWTPYILNTFSFPTFWTLKPVIWFGFISMGATLLAFLVTEVMKRRTDTLDRESTVKSLFLINFMLPIGVIVFGTAGGFVTAVGAYWFTAMFKEARGPFYDAWTNQSLEPEVRATVFSMCSQANALGQIVGGPCLGLIANTISIRISIIAAGLALIPSLFLHKRTLGVENPVITN